MRFYSPLWLWGLLAIPVIGLFLFWDEKRRLERFSTFINRRLWPQIAPEISPEKKIRKMIVLLIGVALVIISLARPQYGSHQEVSHSTGLDIVVALDISNSMETTDVVPSRLLKAKHIIRTMIDQLAGDRVALVAFAGSSYVASPLTTDLYYFLDVLQTINPKMLQNQGTDISRALETSINALDRGAEEGAKDSSTQGQPGESPASSRVILLISDGEDHEPGATQIATKIKESGTRLYVLGLGTEQGGPVPVKDENGSVVAFKKDRAGKTVISQFRPQFLASLAKTAGGKFWAVTSSEDELADLMSVLSGLDRRNFADRKYTVYEERFQIPLLAAILLFLLELSIPVRKLAVVWIGLLWFQSAHAENWLKKPSQLDVYLENRKGIEALKKGKPQEAEQAFGAAQARDPSHPEFEYNQGIAEHELGETDKAVESFKNSVNQAIKSKNEPLLGRSLFNLGNALAKKGDRGEAIKAYLSAIEEAEKIKDQELNDKARKNLQLLINQQKPPPQSKPQESDQKQKDQKQEKEDQSKSKSSGSEEEKKNSKQDRQKDSDRDNQFQSKKMNKEDADRVLSELSARERELQEKLNNQNVKPQTNEKDW